MRVTANGLGTASAVMSVGALFTVSLWETLLPQWNEYRLVPCFFLQVAALILSLIAAFRGNKWWLFFAAVNLILLPMTVLALLVGD